jgi:hypothetical protein
LSALGITFAGSPSYFSRIIYQISHLGPSLGYQPTS